MNFNLRTVTKSKKHLQKFLEERIPLSPNEIFGEIRYDNIDFRIKLLELVKQDIITLKEAQTEIRRRRRIKVNEKF